MQKDKMFSMWSTSINHWWFEHTEQGSQPRHIEFGWCCSQHRYPYACSEVCSIFQFIEHSSLLRTFGLNATSTNDSYLPLLFGKFALIWGHFQNVSVCHFRGRWGRLGQTTSKFKTTKILNENLLKLDEIQNLALVTSKMTSWPQRPRKWLSGFFQKIHF